MRSVEISKAISASEFFAGKELIAEYAASLGIDLCFQNFTEELASLGEMYTPPDGCLLLAQMTNELVGCVAIRRCDASTCEMKRLYVRAKYQGQGAGRYLAEAAIKCAKRLGYTRMVLDTLSSMTAAQALYRSLGFKKISGYYPNPLSGAQFMALDMEKVQDAS
ncbi:MAG TPA: GNAT family N-acetyltransferase [Sulfuriferula sp.]|nr:GNAT family N-acetyltransferase [Sulfuriferula sp.]